MSGLFEDNARYFEQLRNRVRVKTPDPYINAAIGALNIAADAVWDAPQHAIMHGAIAWRAKLLGWRGPYVLDALGWIKSEAKLRRLDRKTKYGPDPAFNSAG